MDSKVPSPYEGKSSLDLLDDLKMELAELAAHGTESSSCTGEIVYLMTEIMVRISRHQVKKALEELVSDQP